MTTEKPLLTDLISYLSFPTNKEHYSTKPLLHKVFDIIRLWGAQFFLAIILGIITTVITSLFSYDTSSNNEISELMSNYDILLMIFFIIIYAPITEELSFRLFLKYSPLRVGVGTILFIYFLIQILDSLGLKTISLITDQFSSPIQLIISVGIFLAVLIFGILFGLLIKLLEEELKLKTIFDKTFPYLFYLSALSFGFAHVGNYTNINDVWFLAPIIVAPQLLVGVLLGFVRVRYGLKYSVILHSLHNSLAYFPTAVLLLFTSSYKDLLTNQSFDYTSLSLTDSLIIIFVVIFFLFVLLLCFISLVQMIIEGVLYLLSR